MQLAQWSAIALLLVTAYIAWQNTRSVHVVERTLHISQRPRFGIQLLWVPGGSIGARVTNVGQGAALDARLTLTYVPRDEANREVVKRSCRLGVAEPGRKVDFVGPAGLDEELEGAEFFSTFQSIKLTGQAQDSLGQHVEVDESLDDLAAFYSTSKGGVELQPRTALEGAMEQLTHELAFIRLEIREAFEGQKQAAPDDVPF